MARDLCASMKMEEGYMMMSVDYNNDESRAKIQAAISKIEREMKIYPSVLRKSISDTAGNFTVEFEVDNVLREGGNFCEMLMKELNIQDCLV